MQKSKFFEIALAVFLALCMWMYVVTVVTPDDDITLTNIPVVFQGEAELRSEYGLVVCGKSVSTVDVKIHGSRSDLRQLNASKNAVTAVLDVSQFTEEREYSSGYDVILPASLQDNDLQVVDRSPRTVQFRVEKMATKMVPVKGVFDGELAAGYVQGDLTFDQDTVKVSGPSELVDRVSYAQVILGGNKLSETVKKLVEVTLIGNDGEPLRSNDLILSSNEVEVTLPVLQEKELPVTFTPVYAAGATQDNTTIKISPETVTVRGPETVLEGMTALDLGELDLAMIADGETLLLDMVPPEDVAIVSQQTQASVTVQFTGLEILKISVTDLRPENLAEQTMAQITTNALEVTLRGPSDALVNLDDAKVYAVADLTEYTQAGEFSVPVRIVTGTENVGALGEYTVKVQLKTIAP